MGIADFNFEVVRGWKEPIKKRFWNHEIARQRHVQIPAQVLKRQFNNYSVGIGRRKSTLCCGQLWKNIPPLVSSTVVLLFSPFTTKTTLKFISLVRRDTANQAEWPNSGRLKLKMLFNADAHSERVQSVIRIPKKW